MAKIVLVFESEVRDGVALTSQTLDLPKVPMVNCLEMASDMARRYDSTSSHSVAFPKRRCFTYVIEDYPAEGVPKSG